VIVREAPSFICFTSFFHSLTLLRAIASDGTDPVSEINAFSAFQANVNIRFSSGRCAPSNSSAAADKWMAQR
jgi:hypothetical protein